MTANDKAPGPVSSAKRRARRLRMTAIIVLLLAIAGEGVVYWLGTRSPGLSNDPSLLGNEKAAARQAGILYGNQALLIQQWTNDLKQPGTQALIIIVTATLAAGGCFYFARLLEHDDQHADETALHNKQ
jgi:flagellar basal body-associated protein FliL